MIRIYFISDRSFAPSITAAAAVLEAIEAGVDMVQIREKDLPARELLGVAREVVGGAGAGTEVYVNSRFDVARAAGATGVHLPASGLAASDVRAAVRRRLRIGVSTHTLDEAMEAEAEGADFVTFGPVFETPSKAAFGPPAGLASLHRTLAAVRVPVYALGGINQQNVDRVLDLPVDGIAVISAIAAAPDKREAVRAFRAAARRVRGGEA
jgi:thiamine-phosphate pyrophosphorylase